MNPETRPTLAVVGCGAVTRQFYLPALSESVLDGDDVIFVDVNESRAEKLAAEFGGGRVTMDYETVLNHVDGAIIAVPHSLHYPIAKDFVSAGVPVLVEKPFVESTSQAEDVLDIADRRSVPVAVNNTRRLFPNVQKAKSLIDGGAIGEPTSVTFEEGGDFAWPTASGFYFDPEDGRGVLLDRGPHVLDLVCYWFDGKPELERYGDDSQGGCEAFAELEFSYPNGLSGSVKLSWLTQLENECTIEGERGTITLGAYDWQEVELRQSGRSERITLDTARESFFAFGSDVLENFLRVAGEGAEPLVSGRDVVDSIQWIEECYANRDSLHLPWMRPEVADE